MSLIDKYNRNIKYLRLSVTDRCDLRCFYCMPKGHRDFEAKSDYLTFDEIEQVIKDNSFDINFTDWYN